MADDYQNTLKGKIKILFQLEKWPDVIKLGEQYNEKYGKDVEVDIMRFKSERRLSKTAHAEEDKARIKTPENQPLKNPHVSAIPETEPDENQPLLLTADQEAVENPAMLILDEIVAEDQPPEVKEKPVDEPFPEVNKLVVVDPFAEDRPEPSRVSYEPAPEADDLVIIDPFDEDKPDFSLLDHEPLLPDANELVITDPYAENEPVFGQAAEKPPVIQIDDGEDVDISIQTEPREEELAIVEENPNEFVDAKNASDFKSNPVMAFDAEPSLAPEPITEPPAIPVSEVDKKSAAESVASEAVILDKSAEVWHQVSDSRVREKVAEKPQPSDEPDNRDLKKPKFIKKITFNFKYFAVLILPLAAAVVLWLALSGKLNLDRGADEKAVAERLVPAVKRPVRKVPAVVPLPETDEKDQLVSAKILQANNFIKNNDLLSALAVVLEAKKIKVTESLSRLEERIAKKIREDEARAAEQKQAAQNMVQSEDQAYANAETENTLDAWQNFLLQYPQGEFITSARNKIVVLQKRAAQKAELDLQLKIKGAQKLKLRSDYINWNQAELDSALQQLGKPIVQFEQLEHGGEKVIIDFASGLMWTLWNKPMVFDKAQWWANRIYAGYSGWRLPTIEEALSLQKMDLSLYAGLSDFAVWTGDGVSDRPRSIWALRLPQGQFIPEDYDQVYYVWAVRKAGK